MSQSNLLNCIRSGSAACITSSAIRAKQSPNRGRSPSNTPSKGRGVQKDCNSKLQTTPLKKKGVPEYAWDASSAVTYACATATGKVCASGMLDLTHCG